MRTKSAVFLLLLVGSMGWAQTKAQPYKAQGLTADPHQTDSAMTAETRNVYQAVAQHVIDAARKMPEDKYSFKPADGMRTFGDLIEHIASVQSTLCANLNGSKSKLASSTHTKESGVTDLLKSVGDCDMAFGELSAENASVMVDAPAERSLISPRSFT